MTTQVQLEDNLVEQGLAVTGLARPQELVELALRELVARRARDKAQPSKAERRPGSARGKLRVLSEDDDHLDDFQDYMP